LLSLISDSNLESVYSVWSFVCRYMYPETCIQTSVVRYLKLERR